MFGVTEFTNAEYS